MTAQTHGTFYGVGVGPGDPELLTLKAVRVLSSCSCIYVPVSKFSRQSYVGEVARRYAGSDCEIREVVFCLSANTAERSRHWHETAVEIVTRLRSGKDVALVTLGDAMLFSTYIYLLQALRDVDPGAVIETVPGISAYSLAAALADVPLGQGRQSLLVMPAVTDMSEVESAVVDGRSLVLMKIGARLQAVIDILERLGALERSVFVSRAGLPGQRIETDLRCLRDADEDAGNLAVIIVQASESRA
ncbi:precorrin-2 C(20)-methyltransferase [Desulfuromonas sp. AOP6]|uniref:precorrin-2 C(20)-methyltransferase n=1 Tax=Desulfuromonas sp. AOP6 TaxID=1566351 RepID=UPI001286CD95|nr:precorrin-2 C(20)-methyltransferase [Desulfuromonas sp. AOP6]BCA79023.1 precorrin-2 C (20)-methyltransferase [Desulfuromonas sp. AOP6]